MQKGTSPRLKTLRRPDYDYSTPGGYFITICTWKRRLLFSRGEGKSAVRQAWEELPEIFGGIGLDEGVVMPNHFHGILWIVDEGAYRLHPGARKPGLGNLRRAEQLLVPTNAPIKHVTLGNIVGAFKTGAASKINRIRGQTGSLVWQRDFYEHVIRNAHKHKTESIREYIRLNPERWEADRENPTIRLFDQPSRSVDDYLPDLSLPSPGIFIISILTRLPGRATIK